ncbi:MAG: class I SAM-dependent methyltransferase [Planctomycetota bacterium]
MAATATKKKRKPKRLTARNADKHDLYQRSVQAPEIDSRFMVRQFKKITGRPLRVFREDFCGTFVVSCHVVQLHREMQVIGVDLDRSTLAWGRKHNLAKLTEDQQRRVTLFQKNVLEVQRPQADLIAATNFSYSVFKTRKEMTAYIKNSYRALRPGGVFLLDIWGGSETQTLQEEEREEEGFAYVWDQDDFDPLTYNTLCKIHFQFKDGSRLRNAFIYDWRLWTIPELREIMQEAGFQDIHILWEGTERDTGEGNGVFRRVKRGDPDEAWIAFVVGSKPG